MIKFEFALDTCKMDDGALVRSSRGWDSGNSHRDWNVKLWKALWGRTWRSSNICAVFLALRSPCTDRFGVWGWENTVTECGFECIPWGQRQKHQASGYLFWIGPRAQVKGFLTKFRAYATSSQVDFRWSLLNFPVLRKPIRFWTSSVSFWFVWWHL